MAQQDKIAFAMSNEERAEIQKIIASLQEKLLPHLTVLTNSERQDFPKMGDKTYSFVVKAAQYIHDNPALVPAYLDVKSLEVDLASLEVLRSLHGQVAQLAEALDDSLLLAGSEAYLETLSFYNAVKIAAKNNVPNAETVYADLSARFTMPRRKK